MKRRLPVHSNSSLGRYRRCPKEFFFYYVMLRKGRGKAAALRFGTLFHAALNAWWRCAGSAIEKLQAGIAAIEAQERERDPFEMAKARALIIGYTTRWGDGEHETLAVELPFNLEIRGEPMRMIDMRGETVGKTIPDVEFSLVGSIDAIVRRRRDGRVRNVEHKTTTADISQGSNYWRHVVTLDPQVSTYDDAARKLGYETADTLYDVIKKPELKPLLATPEDARKYTKPTKKEPIPRLYAGQREDDETPDQYFDRLVADIEARPTFYFQRMPIVRLEQDNEAHEQDVRGTARMIEFSRETGTWPRSPNACERYHQLCEFHDVCSGITTIDDNSRFEDVTREHEKKK